MKNKGIIFDLDGTLWSTSAQIVPVWNQVLDGMGLTPVTMAQMNSFMGKTPDMIASMMLPDMPHSDAMRVFAECVAEEDRFLASHGGMLYEGVKSTLSALGKKYFLAVVSNCGTGYLDIFLDYHKMREVFDDWETFGGTGMQKAENIRLVVQRNGLESAVYVGDTELDKQSAEEADVAFIWAKYGFGNNLSAKYSIGSITELPAVAGELVK